MKTKLAITIGDFNGIGPEVILKSLTDTTVKENIQPILIGSFDVFQHYVSLFSLKLQLVKVESTKQKISSGEIPVLHCHTATAKNIQLGKVAPDAGVCAGSSLERAIMLCSSKEVDGMVTAPISKEAMMFAGYNFPGQTEMLAMLTRSERVTMMLISKSMRVGLATVHVPLRKVSDNLSVDKISDKLETIHQTLQKDFGITSPTIAVLGVNPHAGENGTIGMEEKEIIIPAIAKSIEKKYNVAGPFSADGFFASHEYKKFDAILAMYHDQGLIPLKMSGFDEGVNYSAGLKIIRTSPDHGTAFEIAGKGIANPGSMISAVMMAHSIAQRRKK